MVSGRWLSVYLSVLLVLTLGCNAANRLARLIATPTPTATPTQTPTSTPIPTSTPDRKEEEYLDGLHDFQVRYDEVDGKLTPLFEQLGTDPTVLLDLTWRADWNEGLDEWLEANRALRRLSPPPQYVECHSHLVKMSEHTDAAAKAMKEMVRDYDKLDLQSFKMHMERMGNELAAAADVKGLAIDCLRARGVEWVSSR